MLVNKSFFYWIYVIPKNWKFPIAYKGKLLSKEEYHEHWGKWVILDSKEKLDKLAEKLNQYVENRTIQGIKYSKSPEDVFGLDECVMCVFCDERERDEVWEILAKAGVKIKAWVYDREVFDMWSPGGALIEKWLESHGIKGEEADKIRQKTKKNFEKWLLTIGKENKNLWSFEMM